MAEISYRRHRFPPEIIQHAVWLYLRFTLSYRDVEELPPAVRGRRLPPLRARKAETAQLPPSGVMPAFIPKSRREGVTTRAMRSFMTRSERRGVACKFGRFRSQEIETCSDPLVERAIRVIAVGVGLSCWDPS